jgi:hypothetical protein
MFASAQALSGESLHLKAEVGKFPGGLIVAARSDRPSVRRRETRRQFVRSSRLTAIAARKAGRRPP